VLKLGPSGILSSVIGPIVYIDSITSKERAASNYRVEKGSAAESSDILAYLHSPPLVVSVLATGPKVRRFDPDRGRWIFKGDKNP
jgi:hypothetical protein